MSLPNRPKKKEKASQQEWCFFLRCRHASAPCEDIKTHLAQFMADATPTDAVHTAVDGRTALSSSLRLRAMSVAWWKEEGLLWTWAFGARTLGS